MRNHQWAGTAGSAGRIAALTGPHFRYEEESLYPNLVDVFGTDYVDKLLGDHDGAHRPPPG